MIANDRLPWFHCFPSKLLGALASMRPDEQLVYVVVLLRIYEVRGPMPDPIEATSRRIGINRTRTANALDALFRDGKLVRVEGGIHNPFAISALAEGDARHERLAKAGSSGGKKKAENIKLKQRSPRSDALANAYQEDLDLKSKSVEANASTTPSSDWPKDYREQFWALYPRRTEKKAALSKLDAIARGRQVAWDTFRAGVERYARHVTGTEERYIKHPTTWLNRGCWDDELRAGGSARASFGSGNGAASLLARMLKKEAKNEGDAVVDDARALPAGDASRH